VFRDRHTCNEMRGGEKHRSDLKEMRGFEHIHNRWHSAYCGSFSLYTVRISRVKIGQQTANAHRTGVWQFHHCHASALVCGVCIVNVALGERESV
jgi:hypothetical protein